MKRSRFFNAAACIFSAAFFFCSASCSGGRTTEVTQIQTPSAAVALTDPETDHTVLSEDIALPDSRETESVPFSLTEPSETVAFVQTTSSVQTTTAVQTTTSVPTTAITTTMPTLTAPTVTPPTTKPTTTAHIHSYHKTTSEPTCLERGYVLKTCECGDKQYEYTADALGHNFGEYAVTKNATYKEDGVKTRTCSRCGLQETVVIPKIRPYESMEAAQEMLRLINAERAKAGTAPLTFNNTYYPCAQIRAREIITNYSHTRPGGKPFYTVVDEQGLDRSGGCAENLYNPHGDDVPPIDGHTAFMNSEAHRINLMNPLYKSAAICVLYTEDRTYFVQLFFG